MSGEIVPIEIDPAAYHTWRGQGHAHLLVDVREPWEHETAAISGDVLVPMNELPVRLAEIPTDRDVVLYCHHGVRSFQVAVFLRQQGYTRVRSLHGGIARWAAEIDPGVPHY